MGDLVKSLSAVGGRVYAAGNRLQNEEIRI